MLYAESEYDRFRIRSFWYFYYSLVVFYSVGCLFSCLQQDHSLGRQVVTP